MTERTIKSFLKPKLKRKVKAPQTGDIVRVHQTVKEKGRERVQVFEGLVLAVKKPKNIEATFTVRRVVGGSGVERIFPLYSPNIQQIEKVSAIHSRRSKLYYIRDINKKLKKAKSEEKAKVEKKQAKTKKTEKKADIKKDEKPEASK